MIIPRISCSAISCIPALQGNAFASCWLCLMCLVLCGCDKKSERQVVVYTALDREFSEPLLQDYETGTATKVLAKYDVESTKTVGLVEALIAEQDRPRCDLFWNNEIL